MKRKRGQRGSHKKIKIKQSAENSTNISSSDSEHEHENKPEPEPVKKIEPVPSPVVPITKPQAVYSRVRVKIKSPIPIPVPIANSEPISAPISAPNQTLSEKTPNLQKQPQLEKEDTVASTPKLINTFSRKVGGIKIKTNKISPPGKTETTSTKIEPSVPVTVPSIEEYYNETELNSALSVIRKIMKMEAAAPFNEPVDPVALGIPDYFDVIETPMDFSTICKEIEKGRKCKYKNSEEVYRAVQLIWHNCSKYNNKGDLVIDLMRRVKKNFSKYWGAAGLSTGNHESGQNEDGGSNDKFQKGKSKLKKKKRSTMDHKNDCLCAVCVIRRKKIENEGSPNDSETNHLEQEKSPFENLGTGSPLDTDHSMDYTNEEIKESKPEKSNQKDETTLFSNNQASQTISSGNEASDETDHASDNGNEERNLDEDDIDNNVSSQPKEIFDKIAPIKKNEILVENHSVLELCKDLFNNGSMWTGSRPLIRQPVSVRENPFHSAIASLLKR